MAVWNTAGQPASAVALAMSRYRFTHVRYGTAAAGRAWWLACAALLRLTPQATIALCAIVTCNSNSRIYNACGVIGVWCIDVLLCWFLYWQPASDMSHARMVFERCVSNSSLQTPGGAARARWRVTGEIQQENVFVSSAVKLCLRRSLGLTSLLHNICCL